MYYIVDKSTKTYHRCECERVNHIKYVGHINKTIPELYLLGYTPCEECSPLVRKYKQEERQIRSFAMENGLKIELRDETLYVDSFLSSWKIIHTSRFKLFHENTQSYNKCEIERGNVKKKYHNQECYYPTIMDNLEYIVRHDKYRDTANNAYRKRKKKSKTDRWLYKRSTKRYLNKSVRRVQNLITELEAKELEEKRNYV